MQKARVAVVTGGGSGLGLAICRGLDASGSYRVYSVDREKPSKREEKIVSIQADVTSIKQMKTAMEIVSAAGSKIDLLVNNAGIMRQGSVIGIKERELRELVEVNFLGSCWTVRQAWSRLGDDATILQISSERAIYPREQVGAYGLMKMCAMEMAFQLRLSNPKLRVKIALPGPIDTKMLRDLGSQRYNMLTDVKAQPDQVAGFIMQLLHSEFDILRYDDAREAASDGTGKYVLEDWSGAVKSRLG